MEAIEHSILKYQGLPDRGMRCQFDVDSGEYNSQFEQTSMEMLSQQKHLNKHN